MPTSQIDLQGLSFHPSPVPSRWVALEEGDTWFNATSLSSERPPEGFRP